jgi:general stress protein 13
MTYSVDSIVKCCVTGIEKYGIFVSLDNGYSGLIHISEISDGFVRNIEDYVTISDMILAKIIEVDNENKKVKLTIKGVNFKNKKDVTPVFNSEEGFKPLKEHLNGWIEDKLNEIKENE